MCYENPIVVGLGFYSSIGPEVVLNVKTSYLLYYFHNCFGLVYSKHTFHTVLTSVLKQSKKVERYNSPPSCVLVLLNLSLIVVKNKNKKLFVLRVP